MHRLNRHPFIKTPFYALMVLMLGYMISAPVSLSWAETKIPAADKADINVAVSIRPLYGLVQMVLGDLGQATLLLDKESSPENIVLQPSDHRDLSRSDIIFIVDPMFELNIYNALIDNNKFEFLSDAPGVFLKKRRIEGIFGHNPDQDPDQDHESDHEDGDHHGHDHSFGEMDFHIWLSPQNTIAIIAKIEDRLSHTYPQYREAFAVNALKARQDIIDMDRRIRQILTPIAGSGFLVYQDAYLYFENAYGFDVKAAMLDHHNNGTDIRRIKALRGMASSGAVSCIMSEPQFDQKLINLIDPSSQLNHAVLDPYGIDQPLSNGIYIDLMTDLANAIADCR